MIFPRKRKKKEKKTWTEKRRKKSKGSKENVENIKIVFCCRRERNINSDEGKNVCVCECVCIYLGVYGKKSAHKNGNNNNNTQATPYIDSLTLTSLLLSFSMCVFCYFFMLFFLYSVNQSPWNVVFFSLSIQTFTSKRHKCQSLLSSLIHELLLN